MIFRSRRTMLTLAVLILLLAAFIRMLGLAKGLPYTYYPDEPRYVTIVQEMFKTGDWNPRFFYYPTLFFYLNVAAYFPYYGIGKIAGVFQTVSDIQPPQIVSLAGVGYTPFPTSFLMARGITLLFGVAAVALVMWLTWKLTRDSCAALLAGLLLTVSATHVEYSRYIFPHAIFTTLLLLAFWGSYRVYVRGQTRDYLLAAILSGLAIATMYHGVVILVPFVVAHFLAPHHRGFRDIRLYLAPVLAALVFLALNPYALLAPDAFTRDSSFIIRHYLFAVGGTQAAGMGGAPLYYLTYAWRMEGPLLLLAVVEVVRGILTRHKPTLLLASFVVPYFALISSATARNPRTFLPLIPFLIVLVAVLFAALLPRVTGLSALARVPRIAVIAGMFGLSLLAFVPSTVGTMQATRYLLTVDSRETARAWIVDNLPRGSKIALEWYSPYVDPTLYALEPVFRLIDHPPEWYVANGFDYLIASEGVYRRFYDEPDRYAAEIQLYEALFRYCGTVRTFTDGDYEIRIITCSAESLHSAAAVL